MGGFDQSILKNTRILADNAVGPVFDDTPIFHPFFACQDMIAHIDLSRRIFPLY